MVIGGVSPLCILPKILYQHQKKENRATEIAPPVLNMMAKTALQHLSRQTKIPWRTSRLSKSACLHFHFEIVSNMSNAKSIGHIEVNHASICSKETMKNSDPTCGMHLRH